MDLSVATFFEKNMESTMRIILLFHRAMWHNPWNDVLRQKRDYNISRSYFKILKRSVPVIEIVVCILFAECGFVVFSFCKLVQYRASSNPESGRVD